MLIWLDMLVPTTASPSSGGSSGWAVAPLWLFTTMLSVTVSSVVRSVRSTLADSGLCPAATPGRAASNSTSNARRLNCRIC